MSDPARKTLYAAATQLGFIIGAGIFSVPYIVVHSGFAIGIFWIALLTVALTIVNLFYGEVVACVPGNHRLPGYAQSLLGPWARVVAFVANIVSSWGAIIAYAIIGGEFSFALLGSVLGGSVFWYIIGFGLLGGIIIGRKLHFFERTEFLMTALLVGIMLLVIAAGLGESSWLNFADGWQVRNLFYPYGVILFALGGTGAVPVMHEMVGKSKKKLRLAIVAGSLAAGVLTMLFAIAVVGATGYGTTPEALEGLSKVVGEWIVGIGRMFGLLAIITSYLVMGLNLEEVFRFDLKMPRVVSWFLAIGVPIIAFVVGARNFVNVIDISGSIFVSIQHALILGLFLVLISKQKKPLAPRRALQIISWLLMIIFVSGFFAKILHPLWQ